MKVEVSKMTAEQVPGYQELADRLNAGQDFSDLPWLGGAATKPKLYSDNRFSVLVDLLRKQGFTCETDLDQAEVFKFIEALQSPEQDWVKERWVAVLFLMQLEAHYQQDEGIVGNLTPDQLMAIQDKVEGLGLNLDESPVKPN